MHVTVEIMSHSVGADFRQALDLGRRENRWWTPIREA